MGTVALWYPLVAETGKGGIGFLDLVDAASLATSALRLWLLLDLNLLTNPPHPFVAGVLVLTPLISFDSFPPVRRFQADRCFFNLVGAAPAEACAALIIVCSRSSRRVN